MNSTSNTPQPPKPLVDNDVQTRKFQQWQELADFLQRIWHKPDLEAIKILLTIYVSHFFIEDHPIWTFLLGASSSGKSAIGIRALEHLPITTTVTELTPATFLSGYGEDNGLLNRLMKQQGGNGILVFSDMTPFLNERPEVKAKIIGIIRRLYDGSYEKDVGNRKSQMVWKGKLTCIAACTPALERHWMVHRELGERFLTLRWRCDTSMAGQREAMSCVRKHVGIEHHIQTEFKRLVGNFVEPEDPFGVDASSVMADSKQIEDLAILITTLRTAVNRTAEGRKQVIVGAATREFPTRVMKSLTNFLRASAGLWRKPQTDIQDLRLVYRLAFDTIPHNRFLFIRTLMAYPSRTASTATINGPLEIPHSTYARLLEDLRYLKIITVQVNDNATITVTATPEFSELWENATKNCLDMVYSDGID